MPFMKTRERNTQAKYVVALPRKKKILNVRDYIIPTGRKRKTRWSEEVDKILYGAK